MKYITGYIAMDGGKASVIIVWDGFEVVDYWARVQSRSVELKANIEGFMLSHGIDAKNVVINEDSGGGYLVDVIGCKGFGLGSKGLDLAEYGDLIDAIYGGMMNMDITFAENRTKEAVEKAVLMRGVFYTEEVSEEMTNRVIEAIEYAAKNPDKITKSVLKDAREEWEECFEYVENKGGVLGLQIACKMWGEGTMNLDNLLEEKAHYQSLVDDFGGDDTMTRQTHWNPFDFTNQQTTPTEIKKYLVCRKDGKIHFEKWNGTGWAYNQSSIRFWMNIEPPNELQ